jgi:hypothetical protein
MIQAIKNIFGKKEIKLNSYTLEKPIKRVFYSTNKNKTETLAISNDWKTIYLLKPKGYEVFTELKETCTGSPSVIADLKNNEFVFNAYFLRDNNHEFVNVYDEVVKTFKNTIRNDLTQIVSNNFDTKGTSLVFVVGNESSETDDGYQCYDFNTTEKISLKKYAPYSIQNSYLRPSSYNVDRIDYDLETYFDKQIKNHVYENEEGIKMEHRIKYATTINFESEQFGLIRSDKLPVFTLDVCRKIVTKELPSDFFNKRWIAEDKLYRLNRTSHFEYNPTLIKDFPMKSVQIECVDGNPLFYGFDSKEIFTLTK